jgi:hypothetical protein
MSTHQEQAGQQLPVARMSFRTWYADFDAAKKNDRPLDSAKFREWYAHFDAGKWDRQFEADVTAGRLDWLVAEARNDLQEGRCTDR